MNENNELGAGLPVVAWLHTMHMELGQTDVFASKFKDEPFGIAGVDYSATYKVTSEPLVLQTKADADLNELRQSIEGTTGYKYRAELYDEVWQKARDMGYGNVTMALDDLAAFKANRDTLQAELAAMRGVLLKCMCTFDNCTGMKDQTARVNWYADHMVPTADTVRAVLSNDAAPSQVAADPMAMLDLRVEALKASPWGEHADRTGAFVKGALWHAMRNGGQVAAEVVQVPAYLNSFVAFADYLRLDLRECDEKWDQASAMFEELRALLATSQGEA